MCPASCRIAGRALLELGEAGTSPPVSLAEAEPLGNEIMEGTWPWPQHNT